MTAASSLRRTVEPCKPQASCGHSEVFIIHSLSSHIHFFTFSTKKSGLHRSRQDARGCHLLMSQSSGARTWNDVAGSSMLSSQWIRDHMRAWEVDDLNGHCQICLVSRATAVLVWFPGLARCLASVSHPLHMSSNDHCQQIFEWRVRRLSSMRKQPMPCFMQEDYAGKMMASLTPALPVACRFSFAFKLFDRYMNGFPIGVQKDGKCAALAAQQLAS